MGFSIFIFLGGVAVGLLIVVIFYEMARLIDLVGYNTEDEIKTLEDVIEYVRYEQDRLKNTFGKGAEWLIMDNNSFFKILSATHTDKNGTLTCLGLKVALVGSKQQIIEVL